MPNEQNDQHAKLVEDRNRQYDAAHLKTSRWIMDHLEFIERLGDMSFSIIMIVNKLHRMEGDAGHVDNIDDIIGYGKCARQAYDLMQEAKGREELAADVVAGPWVPTKEQLAAVYGGVNGNGSK